MRVAGIKYPFSRVVLRRILLFMVSVSCPQSYLWCFKGAMPAETHEYVHSDDAHTHTRAHRALTVHTPSHSSNSRHYVFRSSNRP